MIYHRISSLSLDLLAKKHWQPTQLCSVFRQTADKVGTRTAEISAGIQLQAYFYIWELLVKAVCVWFNLDKFAPSPALAFPFPGLLLPLYRVCCLHHASLLHERGHYRQWNHLLLTHYHSQCLSDHPRHRPGGSFSLAGKPEHTATLLESADIFSMTTCLCCICNFFSILAAAWKLVL